MLGLFHVFSDSDFMTRKSRLLIVEDEAAIRSGLVDVFVYHGYEVETAEHGDVGLKMALGGTFDLVLLDVMLPGIDGFEICNRIRQQDRQQPVIMLTAKSSDEDIVQGLTLGADDYVAKPFSVTQLVLRVQAVLRRCGVGEAAEREIRSAAMAWSSILKICAPVKARIISYLPAVKWTCCSICSSRLTVRWRVKSCLRASGATPITWRSRRAPSIFTSPSCGVKSSRTHANPQAIVTVRGAGYRLMLQA